MEPFPRPARSFSLTSVIFSHSRLDLPHAPMQQAHHPWIEKSPFTLRSTHHVSSALGRNCPCASSTAGIWMVVRYFGGARGAFGMGGLGTRTRILEMSGESCPSAVRDRIWTMSCHVHVHAHWKARSRNQEAGSEKQGARSEEQGAGNKQEEARSKGREARSKKQEVESQK